MRSSRSSMRETDACSLRVKPARLAAAASRGFTNDWNGAQHHRPRAGGTSIRGRTCSDRVRRMGGRRKPATETRLGFWKL